jgi:hypothetical protein
MKPHILALTATALVASVFTGAAAADNAYPTEQLPLVGTGGAPGGGTVANVHPNGPQVYAHEIYTLRHAVPGTYQVLLNVFPASRDCTGPAFSVPAATIGTNAAGNGQASFKFTPEIVAPFRGLTFSISWAVTGPATYASSCTIVTLD